MIGWVLWAFLLLAQQGAHTMSSRAKNSDSYWYNTIAAVLSNGIWFGSQFIILDVGMTTLATGDWIYGLKAGLFYIIFCVLGSIGAQWLAINWMEGMLGNDINHKFGSSGGEGKCEGSFVKDLHLHEGDDSRDQSFDPRRVDNSEGGRIGEERH